MAFHSSLYKSAMESSVPTAGSDDEESFVVLEDPEDSLCVSPSIEVTPPLRVNKVRELQNLIKSEIALESEPSMEVPKVNSLSSVASNFPKINISPDTSYEEIQKQVEELIKENETLKNTIVQNNMSMKTHYERFMSYKMEVDSVMNKNKTKFSEAKVIIDNFKEENAKLTAELDVYINLKKLHEEEIINLKAKIRKQENTNYVEVKTEVPSVLNDEIDNLKTELSKAEVQIANLTLENGQLKTEIENFNKKTEELQTTVKTLEDRNKNLDEIPKLKQELILKQQQIDNLKEYLVQTPKLDEQLRTKQQEINVLQFDITAYKERISKLEQENNNLKIEITSGKLTEKAALDFEQKLRVKDEEIKNLQQKVEENMKLLTVIQNKYKAIDKKESTLKEELAQSRQQLSLAQQTITALETDQEKRVQEIEKLRKMLQDMENDEIFALKTQLDVYKNDYEAEKESKTTLKREKDQIAEDLDNVQKRNKQLQNEIETLRARIQPKSDGYTCPKCSFGFNTYQSLENHVHRCLELD